MASTLEIIGFRTYRYGPRTTNLAGGAQGAGVPSPTRANRRVVQTAIANPAVPRTVPIQKRGSAGPAGAMSPDSHNIAPGT